MTRHRIPAISAMLALALLALAGGPTARADVFFLSGGGTIEGELVQYKGDQMVIKVGSGTVSVNKSMVARVEQGPSPAEQYDARAARLDPTADAHVELARWCEDKLLSRQAREHYLAALKLDPDHAAVRSRLGFVKAGDQWVARREALQARKAAAAAQKPPDHNLVYRRKQWRRQFQKLNAGPLSAWLYSDEAQQARQQVVALTDPAAVEPLLEVFGKVEAAEKRQMLVEALAHIGGDEAALALVDVLTRDPDDGVAAKARVALADIESDTALLKMNNLARTGNELARNRVALALADTGSRGMTGVPHLIRNLITREERIIHHEPTESQRSWFASGTHSAYVSDLEPVVAEAAVGWNPVISYLVAGAVLDVKATMQPWKEHVWVTVRHPDALDALRRITGQDFGWDIRAWQRWYYTVYVPARARAAAGAAD